MQYWVIVEGTSQGPMELEELLKLNITPETKVWRDGLTEWIAAKDLSELSSIFMPHSEPTYTTPPIPNVDNTPPIPQVQNPQATWQQASYPHTAPPCPPTNLIWAILSLICCCQVLGIVAVIYAAQVSSLYNQGRYEAAEKASSNAAIWSIVALVGGLISFPIILAFNLLSVFW